MSRETTYAHIVSTPGVCGGKPRIDGHRVRVQDIAVEHEWQALSPEEICREHPELTLGEVHAALGYYYDHRDEILAEIESDRQAVVDFQSNHPGLVG